MVYALPIYVRKVHNQVKTVINYFHNKQISPTYIDLYVTQTLITHLFAYVTLSHNKINTSERYMTVPTWKSRSIHWRQACELEKPHIGGAVRERLLTRLLDRREMATQQGSARSDKPKLRRKISFGNLIARDHGPKPEAWEGETSDGRVENSSS